MEIWPHPQFAQFATICASVAKPCETRSDNCRMVMFGFKAYGNGMRIGAKHFIDAYSSPIGNAPINFGGTVWRQ